MSRLDQHIPIVGEQAVDELRLLGRQLQGKLMRHISSMAVGGGAAEILHRMVPYFRELGIDARWDVIKGNSDFDAVTRKLHAALQGQPQTLTERDFTVYRDTLAQNGADLDLSGDLILTHDPQPAGLIMHKNKTAARWVWDGLLDLSAPQNEAWDFFRPLLEQYDAAIFPCPTFAPPISMRQILVAPSIDPLSERNRDLTAEQVHDVLNDFELNLEKPAVTQVARFDPSKDAAGVIDAYRLAKKRVDCQLWLVGGDPEEDPEGNSGLAAVREKAENDPDIHIFELSSTDHAAVNALQRASTLVLQKSIKEGFGLTVTEALWKGKPVIASALGGIPLQITHNESGILTHSVEGTAYWIRQLLQEPLYAKRLGENGRQRVLDNFLLTRHLRDYLLVFLSTLHPQDILRA
ncbi:MAG: glycosyl transferase family 1 [Elusimicrobia bacterium RIFCSPLOWO2_01_FULL_59_12]|nr:MAG: glycosyl transferase family 1 [Elusimicrobia bacterium RIFCSPLOWO2_01_FULL_59_12]